MAERKEIIFSGKRFLTEENEIDVETIKQMFGFYDGNFALVDKDNVVIRKTQNSFTISMDRSPYQIVRCGQTSTRTFIFCFICKFF